MLGSSDRLTVPKAKLRQLGTLVTSSRRKQQDQTRTSQEGGEALEFEGVETVPCCG